MAEPAESIELQAAVIPLETDVLTTAEEEEAQKQTVKSKRCRPSVVWAVAVSVTVLCIAGGLILYPFLLRPWHEHEDTEDVPIQSRVVGGNVVDKDDDTWPYMVSVQCRSWYFKFLHECGGILVGKRTVLTAAHCLDGDTIFTVRAVVLGDNDLKNSSGRQQFIKVADYKIHPKYNMYNIFGDGVDLALLYLKSEVQFDNKYVKLAPLAPAGTILSSFATCRIAGWGEIYARGPISKKLKEGLLSVVSRPTCTRQDHWGPQLKQNVICARSYKPDLDSMCLGDSGGPLTCIMSYITGLEYVIGVDSIGQQDCKMSSGKFTFPNIFTDISAYRDWIDQGEKEFQRKYGH